MIVIAVAGHVDHGKTSLVKALTGVVTDRLKDEEKRGLTIDLGFAHSVLGSGVRGVEVSFIDVPGHVKFIRNMLAGTGAINSALFIVAGDDGIMPQSKEHFEILKLLAVKNIFAVVTKTDLVAKERVEEVKDEIKELFSLHNVPLSGLSDFSVNSDEAVLQKFKNEITDFALSVESESRSNKFKRFPIDRSFTVKGFGTVVTGTLFNGNVNESDELLQFSTGKALKVRSINVAGNIVSTAMSNTRVALNLSSVEKEDIQRGDLLLSKDFYDLTFNVNTLDCKINFSPFEKVTKKMLKSLRLYFLSSEREVSLRLLKGDDLNSEHNHFGRIHLRQPLPIIAGDKFILREPATNITVGGGEVLVSYTKGKRPYIAFNHFGRSDMQNEILEKLSDRDLPLKTEFILTQAVVISSDDFKRLLPFDFENLSSIDSVLIKNDFVMLKKDFLDMKSKLQSALDFSGGVSLTDAVKTQKAIGKVATIAELALDDLAAEGVLVKEKGKFFSKEIKAELSPSDKIIFEKIVNVMTVEFKAHKKDELFKLVGSSQGDFNKVFILMIDKGDVARLTKDTYIARLHVETSRGKLLDYLDKEGKIVAKEFRDLLGCGRKLAIELLEYFDRVNVTLRKGDERVKR